MVMLSLFTAWMLLEGVTARLCCPSLPVKTAAAPRRAVNAAARASMAAAALLVSAWLSDAASLCGSAASLSAANRGQPPRRASTALTSWEPAGGEASKASCSSAARTAQMSFHSASCGRQRPCLDLARSSAQVRSLA